MAEGRRPVRLLAAAIIAFARFGPAHGETPLAELVQAEAGAVMKSYGIAVAVNLTPTGPILSRPGKGLLIGLDTLAGYLNPQRDNLRSYTVRFVMAHELWHQIQFRDYGADILGGDLETTRLYECQADLMGARYVLSSVGGAIAERGKDAGEAAVALAASLGMPRHSASDHPSEAERRIAAQFGMGLALVEYLDGQPPTQEGASVKYRIRRTLDLVSGETPAEWSLRQCGRIIHYRRADTARIVRGAQEVTWNPSADNPIVSFAITYQNLSDRPMRVSLEIASVEVPRDDQASVARRMRTETLNETFDMPARGSHVVQGVLHWSRGTDTMPKLIIPPQDDGTLIAAVPTGPPVMPAQHTPPENLSARAASLSKVIERLVDCAADGFSACRADAGEDLSGTMSYAASPQIPGSLETDIQVEKNGSSQVDASLYSGPSLEAARLLYDRFKADLAEAYPDSPRAEELSSRTHLPGFKVQTGKAELEVYMYTNGRGRFTVDLMITRTLF